MKNHLMSCLLVLMAACSAGDRNLTNTTEEPDPVFGNGQIEMDPPAMDFTDLELGVTTGLDLTVNSVGDANLVLEELRIYDSGGGVFFVDEVSDITLAPGQSHTQQVTATLDKPMEAFGSLRIRCNDPDTPTVMVELTGHPEGWVPPDSGDSGL